MMRAPTPPTGEDAADTALIAEQTRLLNDGTTSAVLSHLVACGIYALLMWQAVPRGALLAWIAILFASTALRALISRAYRRAAPQRDAMRAWRSRFRFGTALSGATWALTPLMLFPGDSVAHQVMLALVIGGMTAGAITSLAMDLVTALLFVVPPLLALGVRLLLAGGELAYAMSFMVAFFFVFIVASARRTQRAMRENVALRARAEANDAVLIESEARLREAQRIARIGHWSLDTRTGVLAWSDEVYSILGRDPASFKPELERYYAELVHPDDVAAVRRAERAIYDGADRQSVDHRVLRPDGAECWVHLEGYPVCDSSGSRCGISGTVQEITGRKRVESELRDTRNFLSAVIENLPVVVFVKNAKDLRFVIFNRAGEELIGVKREDVLGKTDHDLYSKEQADYLAGWDRRVLASGKLTDIPEAPMHTLRGDPRLVHTVKVPIPGHDGRPAYLLGITEDVTERKRTEIELIRAKEEAERASKAKSTFLSNMSHELRTPMNSILGFSQLLEQDASLGAEQREFVGKIHKAGEHLLSLVNDVLDLARVEAGGITLHPDDHDVALLLDDCHALASPLAARHAVKVVAFEPQGADTAPVYVRADITRLRQVLLNLISNAIKYSPRDSEVTVAAALDGHGMVRISVSDRGPGIPREKHVELFVPFNRLGAERSQVEGSGIGLALAKRLIELMGGRIGFASEPGTGSTFWVELPAVAGLGDAQAPSEQLGVPAAQARADKRCLILYIEDNPANLILVESILKKHRPTCELLTASEPHTGIELARSHTPDLVLLDVALPDMNGYDVARRLRELPETLDIPVVGVSANAMQVDIERGFAAGFEDYVTKPIDVKRFLGVVDKWLRL
jgi:PAS domain S-box-containing protein